MNGPPHIVVFGGSFNPPTVAHTMIVSYLLSLFPEPTEIYVVPVYQHAHAKDMAPFNERLRLVNQAMSQFDRYRVRVSSFEATHKPANTFEMLTKLRVEYPGTMFSFVVGADCYRDRATWHRWDDLQKLAQFIVLGRDGVELAAGDDLAVPLSFPDVSSTQVRQLFSAGNIDQARMFIDRGMVEACQRLYGG